MGIISRIKAVFRRTLHYLIPKKSRPRRHHKKGNQRVIQKSPGAYAFDHANSINKIILSMVNKERRKRSLHSLTYDHDLELHAVRWSKHMAHQKRLSHSGRILENACMVPANGSPASITKSMFYCWRKSKPHWSWMMNARISKAGFGYSIRDKYAYGAFAFDNPH
jgi:uncharacterized protein YkwD